MNDEEGDGCEVIESVCSAWEWSLLLLREEAKERKKERKIERKRYWKKN